HPAIHESKDKMELQELFHWSNSIENPLLQEMIMEYKRAKEQIFTEIKGFGLLLEDQSEISMDSAMSSFSGGRDFFPGDRGGVPMDKALSRLSACLVSNIRSAIFYKAPGEAKFDRVFYDMLAMFNNVPGKKIIKASMIDDHDQKIAEFSVIPSHKRRFLMGICPQQKEFEGLTKTAKWAAKQSFYHRGTDRILRFSEIKVDSIETLKPEKSSAFRIITVWKNDDQKPCWAILTNCARQNSEEILKEYMMRWPYFGEDIKEGSVLELTDSSAVQELPEESIGNVQEMCNDFIVSLHRYCQKHFFPKNYSRIDVNSLLATVYGMSGTFYALKDSMVVSLDMDQGLGYYKDLQYAVRKVNERHIFDYSGRRLWLKT
ncbi:MAG TPA: hypothetical protein PKV41_02740, partial [Candidatus Omnitrophota bacterium]|nr:hypothetical protein [Candidatus Omnitrophota bacterium]